MRSPEALINSYGVLCCGSVVADILVQPVDEPGWGKTTWVENIELNLGGNGGNTAYTLGKLGTPVRLLSAIGQDDFGNEVLCKLQSAGVDTSFIERCASSPTPTSVVLVHSNGMRALLHRPGASQNAFPSGIELSAGMVDGCSHFHLANIFALRRFQEHASVVLRQARERGLRTSMDTAWDPQARWMKTLEPCLPHTDLLFVNQDEARQLTGLEDPERAAAMLHEQGAGAVVVKLGASGCLVQHGGERFAEPGFQVNAVDTTGAGDCFAGGFIAALLRGFDMREAARFANAVGALNVQSLGGVTGIRNFKDTLAWMLSRAITQ